MTQQGLWYYQDKSEREDAQVDSSEADAALESVVDTSDHEATYQDGFMAGFRFVVEEHHASSETARLTDEQMHFSVKAALLEYHLPPTSDSTFDEGFKDGFRYKMQTIRRAQTRSPEPDPD